MKFIVESDKSVEKAAIDLEAIAKENGFGVLHVHDLQATLKSKGFEFQNACKVIELCNAEAANKVLGLDISLNMALPCRISVWEENGKTKIGMLSPRVLLSLISESKDLDCDAVEVEETLRYIMDEAK